MKNKKLIIGISVGVVVAVIAALGTIFLLSQNGDNVLSQNGDNNDDKSREKKDNPSKQEEVVGPVVASYGDYKLSVGEYNYFYMSLYNQAVNTANQYDQYYSGMGAQYFDLSVDPAEQKCQETNLPEGVVTWADYFAYCAPDRGFLAKILYDRAMSAEAKKAGFSLSEEEKTSIQSDIDEAMNKHQKAASANDYKLDEYLSKVYGKDVTEKLYRQLLEKEFVAEIYLSWYQDNAGKTIDDKLVNKYYNENKSDIDIVDIRVFGISYASDYSKDEAFSLANDFVADLSEGKDFKELAVEYALPDQKKEYSEDSATLMKHQTKSSLKAIDDAFGDWAFEDERKANDTYILHNDKSKAYFVVMLETLPTKNMTATSADVRHILIEVNKTTTSDDGKEVLLPEETIEMNKKAAFEKAEKVVKEWEKNGKTEDAFVKLVSMYTNDNGSVTTGGLYEDINSSSNYVAEFIDWSIAEHKKGDVGIIETTFGYHIMYYVGGDTTPKWESDVRRSLGDEAFQKYITDLAESISEGKTLDEEKFSEARESMEEIIRRFAMT